MNTILREMIKQREPLLTNLSDDDKRAYKAGLLMLSAYVCDEFVDIPELGLHKYEKDGLFFHIPYFSSEQLWTQDNQRCLLVVYEIKNKSSFCPLRIDFKYELKEYTVDYSLYVYDQSGQRTIKWELITHNNEERYTTIPEHESIKLSELIGYKRKDLEGVK